MKRPTQQDVANRAGVSRATVSLIMNGQVNGNVRISQETRDRVLAAIDELGYRPNQIAQSLRMQRTNLLALLIPDITNPYYPLLIRGAQAAADKEDYQLLIYDSDDMAEREYKFVDTVLRRRVDGVILVSFHLAIEDVRKLVDAGIEVASLGDNLPAHDLEICMTTQDHKGAIQLLINHLVAKGHQRIAHIAGPLDTPPGLRRMKYYREAIESAGLVFDPELVKVGSFRPDGVSDHIDALMHDLPKPQCPTAIFAANDVMAIEAIQSLTSMGFRVPDDIAVCGFDDIPQSSWIRPTLTTVGQNPFVQGKLVAEMLLNRLMNDGVHEVLRSDIPYTVAFRDST